MPGAAYYIIIKRKKQLMLSLLSPRVIVNNNEIYPLLSSKPILILSDKNHLTIVMTDGFHFTKPVELQFDQPGYYNLGVTCILDDLHLLGGLFVLAVLFILGFYTGSLLIRVLSFFPVAWFLGFYYFNRKNFLKFQKGERPLSQIMKDFDS